MPMPSKAGRKPVGKSAKPSNSDIDRAYKQMMVERKANLKPRNRPS